MKKNYESPLAEVIVFETEAILASNTGNGVANNNENSEELYVQPMG